MCRVGREFNLQLARRGEPVYCHGGISALVVVNGADHCLVVQGIDEHAQSNRGEQSSDWSHMLAASSICKRGKRPRGSQSVLLLDQWIPCAATRYDVVESPCFIQQC